MSELLTRFSPVLEDRLRRAGWFEGRRVDDNLVLERCAHTIRQTGHRLFPIAYDVITEFGGLGAVNPLEQDLISFGGVTAFDIHGLPVQELEPLHFAIWPFVPAETCHSFSFHLEWILGEPIFPIAQFGLDMSVYIGVSGKIYGSGHGVFYYGDTFIHFLESEVGASESIVKRMDIPFIEEKGRRGNLIYDAVTKWNESKSLADQDSEH